MKRRDCSKLLQALASVLVFIVFAASPASAGIVGKDDRLSYIPESFAKAEPAIGIVRTYQGGCTGFCVAENIVATSAHCLIEKPGGWRQLDLRIRFSNFSGKNRLTRYVSGSSTAARRLNVVLGTQDRRRVTCLSCCHFVAPSSSAAS
ncbi:MAG: hypothetical protein AAF441_23200 [Pseudomonadota bacterium]